MEHSPYFAMATNKFLSLDKRKKAMESSFSPEPVAEYDNVASDYISYAAELIKLGVPCTEMSDNLIGIKIQDKYYKVPKPEIKELLGAETYKLFFKESSDSPPVSPEEKTENTSTGDFHEDEDTRTYQMKKDILSSNPTYESPKDNDMNNYNHERYTPPDSFLKQAAYSPPPNDANATNMVPAPWGAGMQMPSYMMNPFIMGMMQCMMPFMNNGFPNPTNSEQMNMWAGMPNMSPPPAAKEKSGSGEILRDVSEIQKRIIILEQERDKATSSAEQMKKRYDDLKKSIKAQDGQFEEYKRKSSAEIKRLQDEKNRLLKQIEKLNSEKLSQDKLLEESKASLAERSKLTKQYEDKIVSLKQELLDNERNADKKLRDTASKLEREYEDKLTNETKRVRTESQNRISQLSEQLEKNKTRIETQQNSINKFNTEKKELESKIAVLQKQLDESSSNETVVELEYYAFHDTKTGVMNQNAFNKRFEQMDRKTTSLAIVSICDMKCVNITYGRPVGDNVIVTVAEKLKKVFPEDCIFRIMGDQFIMALENIETSKLIRQLEEIKNDLGRDSINIIYGTSVGAECDSHIDMVNKAENSINKAKSEPVQYNIPTSDPIAETTQTTDTYNAPSGAEEVSIEEEVLAYMSSV